MDKEIKELLKNTRTSEELASDCEELEPFDFENDVEYVTWFTEGMLIEDILKIMKEQNITKDELALRMGRSKHYVSRILNETTTFTFEKVAEVAIALGVKIEIRIDEK